MYRLKNYFKMYKVSGALHASTEGVSEKKVYPTSVNRCKVFNLIPPQDTININQARTDNGWSPLSTACRKGHVEVVALLLDKVRDAIDINRATTDDGCTPLSMASQNGHSEVVALLIGARDTINVKNLYKFILTRLPAWFGFIAFCRALFRRRVTPPVWIVFTACCWALHRYTTLF